MQTAKLRQKTCCLTRHRELPVHQIWGIAERTANEVRALIINKGVRFFGVGGAIGYDTLATEILCRLREKEFPDIKVILVYPFDGFTKHWTATQKADYSRLLSLYDKVVCVGNRASRAAYLARDRHLVDGLAYCISYCTRNHGGTAYTVQYAMSQGLEIRNVAVR